MTPNLNLEAKAYKIMPDTSTVPNMRHQKLMKVNSSYRHFLVKIRQPYDWL